MKALIILSMEFEEPETIAEALKAIDPPQVPGFNGTARVVLDPEAGVIEQWLDAGEVKDIEVTPN